MGKERFDKEKEDILYIIVPAYNEEENIQNFIDEWYPIIERYNGNGKSRIVIFNDGSGDNTLQIVRKAMRSRPLLQIVDKENSGHGATVLDGYQYALDNGADYIFQTDSDGQTNPDEFYEFWESRFCYDMVIGNRIKRQDGWGRFLVSKVLKLLIGLIFHVNVVDANVPFRLMNRNSLIDCKKMIPDNFYLSNAILSIIYRKKNYKVKIIPITFKSRQGGVNSINVRKIFVIGKNALVDFIKINNKFKNEGFYQKTKFNKKNILRFIPILLLLLIFAFFICFQSCLNFFCMNPVSDIDSSVFKYIAFGMSRGLVPYRDIFDHKGPIIYILNFIGLQLNFYRGIWFIELFFMFFSLLFSYLISKKFVNKVSALFVTIWSFCLMKNFYERGNFVEEYAILFLMISLYIFIDYFYNKSKYFFLDDNKKKKRLRINYKYFNVFVYINGVCFGMTFFLRVNMVALWIVMCSVIVFDCLFNERFYELLRFIISFFLGVMTVSIPIFLYLFFNDVLSYFLDSYFLFNFMYSDVSFSERILSFAYFGEKVFWAFVIMVYSLKFNKLNWEFNVGYIIYMIVNVLLVSVSGRLYGHYGMILVPMLIYPYSLLFKYLLDNSFRIYKIVYYALIFIIFIMWLRFGFKNLNEFNSCAVSGEKVFNSDTVKYIVKNTTDLDYISVFGNLDIIYLATRRLSASRYSYIIPIGEVDSNILNEYFLELEKHKPKVIVFTDDVVNMNYAYEKMIDFIRNNNYVEIDNLDYEVYFWQDN